jgi:plasmid stabilization system protein ParE
VEIEWSLAARADLARIFDFNLRWGLQRAEKVDARLYERVSQLREYPELGEAADRNCLHKLSVPDIGYIILYEFDGTSVFIVAVWHGRENRSAQ